MTLKLILNSQKCPALLGILQEMKELEKLNMALYKNYYNSQRFLPPSPRNIPWYFFFLVSLGGVRLSPLGTSATVCLLYQPRMIDDDDYGAVGGMRIGRGNRSTRRKPAPVPLCPPQIPHDLIWDWTRAAAVESQRLTAWAMARPPLILTG
jgi:hypothetical protein